MLFKLLGWDYNLLVLKKCFHVVDCKWHVESLVSAMDCALMSLSKAIPLAHNNLLMSLSYGMDYAAMSLSRVCPGQCDRLCLLKPVQSLPRQTIISIIFITYIISYYIFFDYFYAIERHKHCVGR